jgi:competence protein ComEC
MHPLLALRGALRRITRALYVEPDASLQLGLLIGDKAGVPRQLTQEFRATGTSHVLAVSGYNVALVADTAVLLLCLAGIARRRSAVATICAVLAFTGLAGADPPVLRAAVMGSLALVAVALGRARSSGALVVTAAAMLVADPLALRHDIGFRLSFGAVLGLGLYGGHFTRLLAPRLKSEGVAEALGQTLGAIVATLPVMLVDFGQFSLTAPVVNVLIAPLIPFSTAAGAISVSLGAVWLPLGVPVAAASAAALRLMSAIVHAFASAVPVLPLQLSLPQGALLCLPLFLLWRSLETSAPKP